MASSSNSFIVFKHSQFFFQWGSGITRPTTMNFSGIQFLFKNYMNKLVKMNTFIGNTKLTCCKCL